MKVLNLLKNYFSHYILTLKVELKTIKFIFALKINFSVYEIHSIFLQLLKMKATLRKKFLKGRCESIKLVEKLFQTLYIDSQSRTQNKQVYFFLKIYFSAYDIHSIFLQLLKIKATIRRKFLKGRYDSIILVEILFQSLYIYFQSRTQNNQGHFGNKIQLCSV